MTALRPLYVYWTAILAVLTVFICSLYDPSNAEAAVPFAWDAGRLVSMLTSPWLALCVILGGAGIVYARRVWSGSDAFSTTDKMVTIWFLMNAVWYHVGCDILSGLFQVMPNMTDAYIAMNRAHLQPVNHPDRLGLDVVYYIELFLQMPLCYLVYFLYLRRSPVRPVVEAFLCALHIAGTIAYYLPNLILGHSSHPILSNMDRGFGALWVIIPTLLAVRAVKQLAVAREESPEPAVPVGAPVTLAS